MDDWAHGYDVSVGYTYGFCREIAPAWLNFCARLAGRLPPSSAPGKPLRYLELGMGQGMGITLLAAANPDIDFVGVDFHPEHVAHAQGLVDAAELTNIRFSPADFMALADDWPADFGTFDYVVLHGIFSWVSPQVRAAVVQCLAHATHAGSLVYNGYNAQPGWLGTMPFQHITRLIKDTSGHPSDKVLSDSIALFDQLRTGGAATFQILPGLKARLDSVKTKNLGYLVGEYMHENWHPLWHSQVARELAAVDLAPIGTATVAETMLPDLLPPALRDTIVAQPDARLRQDLQDFVTNQFFRRDLFQRGPTGPADTNAADTPLCLLVPPRGDVEIKTSFGEIRLQRPAFAEILETLDTHGHRTIAQLRALPGMQRQGAAVSQQILLLLLQAGVLGIGSSGMQASPSVQRLNRAIARAGAQGLPYDHIATASTGSATAVTNVQLMMLDAWLSQAGAINASQLAVAAARRLQALDRPLPQDRSLDLLAGDFLDQTLPLWRRLVAL